MNVICLNGRLAADPECGESGGGVVYATFGLAIEKGYGENKSTMFLDIVTFRQQADFVRQHLHKGDAINVIGSVNVRDWTDGSGVKHRKYEVLATQITFPVSGKSRSAIGNGQAKGQGTPRNGQKPAYAAAGAGEPQPWDNGY